MAVLLPAILKYFINDYTTSGGLWPIPMQSQQLSHYFLEETALLNLRLTVLLPQLSISINANICDSLRTAE